jgi:hypothetical protein
LDQGEKLLSSLRPNVAELSVGAIVGTWATAGQDFPQIDLKPKSKGIGVDPPALRVLVELHPDELWVRQLAVTPES